MPNTNRTRDVKERLESMISYSVTGTPIQDASKAMTCGIRAGWPEKKEILIFLPHPGYNVKDSVRAKLNIRSGLIHDESSFD